jgi:hypothetical protein
MKNMQQVYETKEKRLNEKLKLQRDQLASKENELQARVSDHNGIAFALIK